MPDTPHDLAHRLATQAEAVAAIAADAGLAGDLLRDLAGRPRALALRHAAGR